MVPSGPGFIQEYLQLLGLQRQVIEYDQATAATDTMATVRALAPATLIQLLT
jgi:hypothetical protein